MDAIKAAEQEVLQAWKGLLEASEGRRARLVETAEKFRFFTMVRDLMAWMESIIQQIETQEKPRSVLKDLLCEICLTIQKIRIYVVDFSELV